MGIMRIGFSFLKMAVFGGLIMVMFSSYSISNAAVVGVTPESLNIGLVGHWTFDGKNMTPNVIDSSVYANNARVVGQSATTSVTGVIGQALDLDGANDHVSIPSPNGSPLGFSTSSLSISIWIKPRTFGIGNYGRILDNVTTVSVVKGYSLFLNNSPGGNPAGTETLSTCIGYGSATAVCSTANSNSITLGVWQHIVMTYATSSGAVIFYVNGVNRGGSTLGQTIAQGSSEILLGNRVADLIRQYNGSVDDLRLYNRVLSANEVRTLYNIGSNKTGVTSSTRNIPNGLIGHWTFDGKDMAPTVRDISGLANHGTLVGQISTTSVVGKFGQALRFDGANDYLNISAVANDIGTGSTTISAWVKLDDPHTSASSLKSVFSLNDSPSSNDMALCFKGGGTTICGTTGGSNGAICFMTYSGAFNNACSAQTSWNSNVWYHIVGKIDQTGTYLYVDGVQVGYNSNSRRGSSQSVTSSIASEWNGPQINFFKGTIDDFRVYKRGLSIEEIRQLYNLGVTKLGITSTSTAYSYSSGLVGYWTFDGKNMVPNVRDSSGLGNHGYITGQSSTTTYPGRIGQALVFDGIDDNVNAGSASSLKPSLPISISTWVKLDSIHPTLSVPLVAFRDGENHNGYWLQVGPDKSVQVNFGSNTSCNVTSRRTGSTGANKIEVGNWYHIVGTIRGDTDMNIYINNVSESLSYTGSGGSITYSGSSALRIGTSAIGGGPGCVPVYADGLIDEVRVYNKALSQSEVKQLYGLGR